MEERLWELVDWKLRVKKMRNKRVLTARITITAILPKAKVKRKPPATKVSNSILRERIHKFVNEGWSPRVRNLKSGIRLTVRKRVDGVRKEKYIGTYDENTKKILEEEGYPLD